MLVPNHGVLQLMVTFSTLVAITFSSNFGKRIEGFSFQDLKNETRGQNLFDLKVNESHSATDRLKSHRRIPRFDKAAATPYVRFFNKPPGTKDSFFNYETRGNTSAHTSGEQWDLFTGEKFEYDTEEIDRSDVKVKDILRVKPKTQEVSKIDDSKIKTAAETTPSSKHISSTTKSPDRVAHYTAPKLSNQKESYVVWTTDNDGGKLGSDHEGKTSGEVSKVETATIKTGLKDSSHWKVVDDGSGEGWQVVDDKGEVEWKIEYDDGEWRVISTGDFPDDAEWVDPDYIYGQSESSGNYEPEYNSWQQEGYKLPPNWPSSEVYYTGTSNNSWPQDEDNTQKKENENSQIINSGWKSDSPPTATENTNEKIRFGVRRNIPTKPPDTLSEEELTSVQTPEEQKNDASIEEKFQNGQIIFVGKSWVPQAPVIKSGQKWVQGYGTKSWESDSTGWNSKTAGETWVAANKNYATDPWIPKIPGEKSDQHPTSTEESNTSTQDNSIRAWGTGYGSKTWKGNEWDSNVVWKTGVNSNIPWSAENSTWQFPPTSNEKKKPEVWSQPIPSNVATTVTKVTPPPKKRVDVVRTKWPVRPINKGNTAFKSPPSRTESESWGDDDSTGGVVWKEDESDDSIPTGKKLYFPKGNSWKSNGWKVASGDSQEPTPAPWKNNPPPKSNNLVSINWKTGGINPLDSDAIAWNKGQWPGANLEPTWIFQGCKMTLKCGSNDQITNNNYQSTLPDTSDDDTAETTTTTAAPVVSVTKGWPPKQNLGKSWKPPLKTWKPPKWKKPTSAPTTPETMTTTMTWKATPKPKIYWKKPTPNVWKQPPTTMMWTETTPQPPEMTWKPSPPAMKWKKARKPTKSWKAPPTKSWKPPPTKSWKPPKMPVKTWPPPIATPQPDNWPPTKPDCKDTTDPTEPPQPLKEDDDMEHPQIIIITKLPKGSSMGPNDKNDKDDKKTKPSSGPWVFPPRKYNNKFSKNRKDKNIPVGSSKWQSNRPLRNIYKQTVHKGWPKDMPPAKYPWPSNAMRRWTTKKPTSLSEWKSKYSKSKSWREVFRKWMSGLQI